MFNRVLCRFLMLSAFVLGALGCSCTYDHPQKHFCEHEFVLKVKVREEKKMPPGHGFRVEIRKIYKGNLKNLNLTKGRSVILEMPPACNIDLMQTGDKYAIFANSSNGNIYTDICSGNMPWYMTTKFYRRSLTKFFKSGCDCYPEFEPYPKYDKCNWNSSFLKRHGKKCEWVKTKFWRECKKSSHSAE